MDEILVAAGAGQMQQGWEMLPDPPNFQFVEVESFLLDCVKDELKEIRKRTIDAFRKKYPQKSFSQMTASQLSVVWVTPYLNLLFDVVNEDVNRTHYSKEVCLGFILHEAMIMSYNTSAESYFDDSTPGRYRKPGVGIHVSKTIYFDILRRLSHRYNANPAENEISETWCPPFSPNVKVQHAQEVIRTFCSKFGYVPKKSILSLDDDLLRLRSPVVEPSIGSSRIRNPKKGFGPMQHGLVSLLTGLYLGGHIPAMNEGTVESVKCLFLSLGKATGEVNLEQQMAGKIKNMVALDRGYGYDEIIKILTFYGSRLVGTFKRCALSPFVYGDAKKFAHQTVISEKGPKFSLYARQALCKDADGTPVPSITGVHRSGSGNCFMTHTMCTCPELGLHKWAYETIGGTPG